jgi:hypothetical protein
VVPCDFRISKVSRNGLGSGVRGSVSRGGRYFVVVPAQQAPGLAIEFFAERCQCREPYRSCATIFED